MLSMSKHPKITRIRQWQAVVGALMLLLLAGGLASMPAAYAGPGGTKTAAAPTANRITASKSVKNDVSAALSTLPPKAMTTNRVNENPKIMTSNWFRYNRNTAPGKGVQTTFGQ